MRTPVQSARMLGTQRPTKRPYSRLTRNQRATLATKLIKVASRNGQSIFVSIGGEKASEPRFHDGPLHLPPLNALRTPALANNLTNIQDPTAPA